MHLTLFTTATLLASVLASPTPDSDQLASHILTRARLKLATRSAAQDSQTSYAPATSQACPFPASHDYVRPATGLSSNETTYIQARVTNAQSSLRTFFSKANLTTDVETLLSNADTTPRVALAVSGGGYRAMLHGAGGFTAIDSRNDTALAGLLQGSIYMAGLSGGSWAVTSIAASNMASPYYLESAVWDMEDSLILPSGFSTTVDYFSDIVADVLEKKAAGFDTSITDLWARALSYHLFDNSVYPQHAATTPFGAAIRNTSTFQAAQMPYPLVVTLEREPGQVVVGQNASIFYFDAYEFGSFEPLGGVGLGGEVGAFVPIDLVGTSFDGGMVAEGKCVYDFDNIGFTVGTSASLFNQALLEIAQSDSTDGVVASALQSAIKAVLGAISAKDNDIAPYPNPWHGYEPNVNVIANNTQISMVDGGEALDNIPLWPLLNSAREVDFILAFDSSADTTYSWPNGTAMVATYNRTLHNNQNHSFPNVPPNQNSWVNLGLNSRPTFFGCNASDVTNYDASAHPTPIIAYIPAYPWSHFANTSTFMLQYSHDQSVSGLDNGFHSMELNGTVSSWPACLTCGVIKRAVERAGMSHSAQCQECYDTWCWDGSTNDTQPAEYEPLLGSLPAFVAKITNQSQYGPNTVYPTPAGALSAAVSLKPVTAAPGMVVSLCAVALMVVSSCL